MAIIGRRGRGCGDGDGTFGGGGRVARVPHTHSGLSRFPFAFPLANCWNWTSSGIDCAFHGRLRSQFTQQMRR